MQNHDKNSYKQMLTINGKEVSFEMLYTMIGKRFHQCLAGAAKSPDADQYEKMTD